MVHGSVKYLVGLILASLLAIAALSFAQTTTMSSRKQLVSIEDLSRQYYVTEKVMETVDNKIKRPRKQHIVLNVTKDAGVKDWPPLRTLIADRRANITADVQFMMDFAIIGHPKTATSFTLNWLSSHEEIQMPPHELQAMQSGRPAELVSLLYKLPAGKYYKRGYKAPRDVQNPKALRAFAKHFPLTKLVVGLRHPVLWFESFYNFRVRHGFKMPPAEMLIGELQNGWHGVSTGEANFHLHLDNLGKTPRSIEEQKLLSWGKHKKPNLPKIKNPVFLYEISQLHDDNKTRSNLYLADLKEYLGLQNNLNPIAKSNSTRVKFQAIRICNAKYDQIRRELMKIARESSIWIRRYFLKSPDVHVSSRAHFSTLLKTWLVDPCITD